MTIKVGYEQFVPPRVPPGMWFDPDTWLILPQGARPAGKGRVAASFFLAVGLFIATLGLGYLIWQVVAWDQARRRRSGCWGCAAGGRTPARWPAESTWRYARPPGCS